jgi:phosphatidylglycerophosphate synthase
MGAQPNTVSVAGLCFAIVSAAAFAWVPDAQPGSRRVGLLLIAAAGIQLRLLCNLLDGMLAVEGGLKSRTGDLFNELPDRIADVVILVGAGYAVRESPFGVTLGWLAAVLALFTAYVRLLGASLALPQSFIGPMAKPHRMFTLTVAACGAAVEFAARMPPRAIRAALFVIVAGAIVTAVRRIVRIAAGVRAR